MTEELSEPMMEARNKDTILGDNIKEEPVEAISEPAPFTPAYTSERIGEIVKQHISNIRKHSLVLEGISADDIEYDNPEVHPQMMMDNLKDAAVRLELAVKNIRRLASLTAERRKQLDKTDE